MEINNQVLQQIKNECINKIRQLGHSLGKEILILVEKKIQFAKDEDEIKDILNDLYHKYQEFHIPKFDSVGIDDFIKEIKPKIETKKGTKNLENPSISILAQKYIKENNTAGACYFIAEHFIKKYNLITFSDTDEIYIYIDGVYLPRGSEILKKEIQEIFQDYCKIHLVKEIFGHIQRLTLKNRNEIKEPTDKICLANGILNLNDLTIVEHSPKTFFLNKLPVEYKKDVKCPKIEEFLKQIVSEQNIFLLQELVGYCLIKDYFIHKAFMLVGAGANGKSTFLNLLKTLLGAENIASISLQRLSNNRFSVSSLFGKLVNVFADLSSQALRETSMFKMLVGQDLLPAEKKFKDEFFFVNYAKLIFSANQIPKSQEDTDAFFRRWIIINFPNKFLDKADKHLIKKLTTFEELSGFLNFALEGLKRLQTNGDFSANKSIEETRDQYIRMSDSVGAFIMDMILISPENDISKKELYTAYCDYCRKDESPIEAENTFHRRLQQKIRVEDFRPLREIDGKKVRVQCWKGINLNNINTQNNLDNLDNLDINNNNVNPVNDVKVKSSINVEEIKIR